MMQFKETPPHVEADESQAVELWADSARSESPRAPDWRAVVTLARRNLGLIVATAIIVAVLCALAITLTFNQYVATATVLFDPRNAKVTASEEVLPDIGPDSVAIESVVQVAKSDGFLGALVEREGLLSNPEFGGSGGRPPNAATQRSGRCATG
jgi:succinoglycan biosynthesis transport protein ExoP